MNFIDILIIIFLVSSCVRGYHIGLLRQAGSTLGFVGGLFLGSAIANLFINHIQDSLAKSLTSLFVVLGVSLVFMTAGEVGGIYLKRRVINHPVDKLDGGFGSVMSAATTLFGIWLVASILLLAPASNLQQQIKSSRILATLNHSLPPASKILSSLNKLIDPNGFPQVFTGLEPHPNANTPLPSLGSFDGVVANSRASVVKIEGVGCGGIVEGSGFVYANGRVVTNAHVVAGVASPKVLDSNGTHNTQVVWFNDKLDLAVLRVNGLAGKPLHINTSAQNNGTAGVVLGYPGGGDFNAQTASVLDRFTAIGRSIYGQGTTTREVYSLQAHVIPGNSGGPFIGADGSVLGIVFATSTQYNNVGYALTAQQASTDLTQAQQANTTVSTGQCSE